MAILGWRGFHRVVGLIFAITGILFSLCAAVQARDSDVAQRQNVPRYASTTEGLKLFLMDGIAAAKSGDKGRLDAFMKQTTILRAYDWFIATYGEKDGTAGVDNYLANAEENNSDIEASFARIVREGGEISTRRVNDRPEAGNKIEQEMLQGLKRPTSFYYAAWRRPGTPSAKGELIGYFVFIEGKFRVVRVNQRNVRISFAVGAENGIELAHPIKPSISGTKYTNPEGHFSLELPTGWTINEEMTKAPMAIGGVSDPDGWANLAIQLWPRKPGGIPSSIRRSRSDYVRGLQESGIVHDYVRWGRSGFDEDSFHGPTIEIPGNYYPQKNGVVGGGYSREGSDYRV